jgi:Cu2+-exporting ATPase
MFPQGVLELTPRLRSKVPTPVSRLRLRGFKKLAIEFGDQQAPTERMINTLGFDPAHGEVLPHDKVELVKKIQAQGHRVCANVSVYLSRASAITSEATQLVFLQDLKPLPKLFGIAELLHKRLGNSLRLWLGFGLPNDMAIPFLAFGPFQSSLLYATTYVSGLKFSRKKSISKLPHKGLK